MAAWRRGPHRQVGTIAQHASKPAGLSSRGGAGIIKAGLSCVPLEAGPLAGGGAGVVGMWVSRRSRHQNLRVVPRAEAEVSQTRAHHCSRNIGTGRFLAARSRGYRRRMGITAQRTSEMAELSPRGSAGIVEAQVSRPNWRREKAKISKTRRSRGATRGGRFITSRWRRYQSEVGIVKQQVALPASLSPRGGAGIRDG